MPIIEVSHLTKEYRLGAMQGLKQTMLNTAARLTGKKVEKRPLFKALDDVSFTIEQGEVVGIIGHNGAGKSTLLKMLARISTPTRGTINAHGRIAPLIEVGAGFVPDFTGRENVYLNGTIMGMSRKDIEKKFDEIVAFAEMEEFIDTPVKRYSSGMQVRLAFAVATSIESEILIVDEVLAVGDLAFQRKCFDRMEDIIKRQSRTVLLVSHNIRQVERLCSRAMLLDHGRVIADGDATKVSEQFFKSSYAKITHQHAAQVSQRHLRKSGEVELKSVELINQHEEVTDSLVLGEPVIVRITFEANVPLGKPEILCGFHTSDFVYITTMGTAHLDDRPDFKLGTNVVECIVDNLTLVPGAYYVRLAVLDQYRREVFSGDMLKAFNVTPPTGFSTSKIPVLGLVYTPAGWQFSHTSG